ncbi:BTB/POZ domain-containing protein At4g08455-like [Rutidosis leptorrhynchoides]|uniref:BTB/POZ domain-containing protein At4g08455-like n=1 Tax=Rutidosis leptorrhynchoides TaxID=125765 RepID=UPI003A9A16B1
MTCIACGKWMSADSDSDSEAAGTCRACYVKAIKTENEELKSKVSFLMFWDPLDSQPDYDHPSTDRFFSDIVLIAVDLDSGKPVANSVPVPANKALLADRSPVFRAMLATEMEETLSGTIKLSDVSHEAVRTFVNFLYIGETPLDDDMACELIILADKYDVKYLKTYCEKFLISKLNWERSLKNYLFAHQHNAKNLLDAALSMIFDNMDKLSKQEGYVELVEKDHRFVMDIYETYFSKKENFSKKVTTAPDVVTGNDVRRIFPFGPSKTCTRPPKPGFHDHFHQTTISVTPQYVIVEKEFSGSVQSKALTTTYADEVCDWSILVDTQKANVVLKRAEELMKFCFRKRIKDRLYDNFRKAEEEGMSYHVGTWFRKELEHLLNCNLKSGDEKIVTI